MEPAHQLSVSIALECYVGVVGLSYALHWEHAADPSRLPSEHASLCFSINLAKFWPNMASPRSTHPHVLLKTHFGIFPTGTRIKQAVQWHTSLLFLISGLLLCYHSARKVYTFFPGLMNSLVLDVTSFQLGRICPGLAQLGQFRAFLGALKPQGHF